jgi:hypothetical protein
MRYFAVAVVVLASAAWGAAAIDDLRSATHKIDTIKSDRLHAGNSVDLSLPELNAWIASQAPAGVRQTRLTIDSPGVATGSALVDIAKVSRSQGFEPGWLLSRILEGERPVKVTAHIKSSGGTATVDVQRVEIGGLDIDGKTLEMMIQYILLPVYPNAVVGRPFDLGHHVDRFDVQPAAVRVVIGR